jgi:hypothetical protein
MADENELEHGELIELVREALKNGGSPDEAVKVLVRKSQAEPTLLASVIEAYARYLISSERGSRRVAAFHEPRGTFTESVVAAARSPLQAGYDQSVLRRLNDRLSDFPIPFTDKLLKNATFADLR